jgi:hypothetical protein
MPLRSDNVLSWLIPSFLAALLGILGWIGVNINEMSKSLALVVYRIDDHEKRIDYIESWDFSKTRKTSKGNKDDG